jgi:hypothetical protein
MVVRVKLCLPISALAPAVTAADVAPVVIAVSVAAVTAPADPPAVAAPVASTAAVPVPVAVYLVPAGPSSFRRSIAQCEPLDIFPPRVSFVGLP